MTHLPPPRMPRRSPDAPPRLSGPLAVLFWCACAITAVPLAGAFSLIASLGPQAALSATVDGLSGNEPATQLLRIGLIPQGVLFVWGACFVVLTVARARATLKIAPLLLIGWVLVTAWSQLTIRAALATDGMTVMDFAALLPGLMAQACAAAALFGYFSEGKRPRAYYTR